jgi:hypothetical protein
VTTSLLAVPHAAMPERDQVLSCRFKRSRGSTNDSQKTAPRRAGRAARAQSCGTLPPIELHQECTKEVDPELWRKIAERHIVAQRQRGANGHARERICDLPTIDKLLRESLNKERTSPRIGLQTSWATRMQAMCGTNSRTFCRAIREVRLDRDARVGEIIRAVTDAIAQDPPPSVESVAKRLGFTNSWALWKHARNRCNELVGRQKTYENARWEGIRAELQAILREHPPS